MADKQKKHSAPTHLCSNFQTQLSRSQFRNKRSRAEALIMFRLRSITHPKSLLINPNPKHSWRNNSPLTQSLLELDSEELPLVKFWKSQYEVHLIVWINLWEILTDSFCQQMIFTDQIKLDINLKSIDFSVIQNLLFYINWWLTFVTF